MPRAPCDEHSAIESERIARQTARRVLQSANLSGRPVVSSPGNVGDVGDSKAKLASSGVRSKKTGDTLALCLGEKPFVGCVSIEGTVRTVVIVVVLPLAKLRVEKMNIVGDAILIQQLVELLVVHPM